MSKHLKQKSSVLGDSDDDGEPARSAQHEVELNDLHCRFTPKDGLMCVPVPSFQLREPVSAAYGLVETYDDLLLQEVAAESGTTLFGSPPPPTITIDEAIGKSSLLAICSF